MSKRKLQVSRLKNENVRKTGDVIKNSRAQQQSSLFGINTIESKTRQILNALNEDSLFSPSLDENVTTLQKQSKVTNKGNI